MSDFYYRAQNFDGNYFEKFNSLAQNEKHETDCRNEVR